MSLVLGVDGDPWRARVAALVQPGRGGTAGEVGVVPVLKGNGYGFGPLRLAAESARAGAGTVAVGVGAEADVVLAGRGSAPGSGAGSASEDEQPRFTGDVVVMNPALDVRAALRGADAGGDRLLHTVSRLADLRSLATADARPRVLVEVLTSMKRHGIAPADLPHVVDLLDDVGFEGWSLHLPLGGGGTDEARALTRAALATRRAPVWLSHVDRPTCHALAAELGVPVWLRSGTDLWLGDRSLLHPRATVLDVHPVQRGEQVGYRRVRVPAGSVVVVAGGTAHGIGLESPTTPGGLRVRAEVLARAGLAASGRLRSPFHHGRRRLHYAEAPHMQESMLLWPGDLGPTPAIGDTLAVDVRYTTTAFDDVVLA